ncbi:MAG: folylpolyglutamate synthase/dihydrofolate synthase family protein [Nocardioidaceae bacterium]
MSNAPTNSRAASRADSGSVAYAEVERALLARWPETKLQPSLDRIRDLVGLLGDPQTAYPSIHLTGTNGKTSTSRMIDTLLGARGLRTGRFTSPHVEQMTERISIDGAPIAPDAFVATYREVAPYAALVDAASEHPLSFFELMVAMAYAAFADAPVDAAVVEVGMGGAWDATNVIDASVAVIAPIAVDHAKYLGDTPEEIAVEKVGIVKPGATVVLAEQTDAVLEVVYERANEVGATVLREGIDFGVVSRLPAVGGQVVTLRGLRGEYDELFLPLYGAHQAGNAALALAAVEAFAGEDRLADELVRDAFAEFTSPARLEVIRRAPTILVDAAHNPHGAAATVEAIRDSFAFDPLIGVVAVMADKDAEGLLAELEPVLGQVVCTRNSTDRSMSPEALGAVAADIFGEHRVRVVSRLDDAIADAVALAETGGSQGESIGSGGVLVTGSVVTAGEARALLRRRTPGEQP